MSVGEKLDSLAIDTIIHILSLDHFNLIKKYANKDAGILDKYGSKLCLRKTSKTGYGHSYRNWYETQGYTNIITSDIICNNESIHECW